MISGLRTQLARRSRWPPWRAIGQTAATLNSGTQTPISTAIQRQPLRAAEPLGQRQRDEGVEAEGDLRARRRAARAVDAGPAAERAAPARCRRRAMPTPAGAEARAPAPARAGCARSSGTAAPGTAGSRPGARPASQTRRFERGVAAEQTADSDQQEVGKQQLGEVRHPDEYAERVAGLCPASRGAGAHAPSTRGVRRFRPQEYSMPNRRSLHRRRRSRRRRRWPAAARLGAGLSEQAGAAASCRSRRAAPPTSLPASSPRRSARPLGQTVIVENKAGGGGVDRRHRDRARRAGRLHARHGHGVDHRGQPGDQPEDRLQPDHRLHADHQRRGHAQRDRGAPELPGQGLQGLHRRAEEEPRQVLATRARAPAASATCRWSCSRTCRAPSSRTSRTAAPARR